MGTISTQAGIVQGSPPNITVCEYNSGCEHLTVLTLTNFVIGTIAGANKGIGTAFYALPIGTMLHTASFMDLQVFVPTTSTTIKLGIGSVVASGSVTVLSGTATFMDFVTQQSGTATASSPTAIQVGPIGATAGILTGISLTPTTFFLNCAGGWSDTGSVTATGVIVLKWSTIFTSNS
jgi:hypothetical protein